MNAKKVIIDCDPGIDDALALMLNPPFHILMIGFQKRHEHFF